MLRKVVILIIKFTGSQTLGNRIFFNFIMSRSFKTSTSLSIDSLPPLKTVSSSRPSSARPSPKPTSCSSPVADRLLKRGEEYKKHREALASTPRYSFTPEITEKSKRIASHLPPLYLRPRSDPKPATVPPVPPRPQSSRHSPSQHLHQMKQWEQDRQFRVQTARMLKEQQDLQECRFLPQTTRSTPSESSFNDRLEADKERRALRLLKLKQEEDERIAAICKRKKTERSSENLPPLSFNTPKKGNPSELRTQMLPPRLPPATPPRDLSLEQVLRLGQRNY